MTHKNVNPINPANPKRVAIVLSNPSTSTTTGWPVGFWWAELSHPCSYFTTSGYQVELFSPEGGACQADAMSDPEDASQWQADDVISRGCKHDPEFLKILDPDPGPLTIRAGAVLINQQGPLSRRADVQGLLLNSATGAAGGMPLGSGGMPLPDGGMPVIGCCRCWLPGYLSHRGKEYW